MITVDQVNARRESLTAELTELEHNHPDRDSMIAAYYAKVAEYTVFDQAIDALIRFQVEYTDRDIVDEILSVPEKLWADKLNSLDCDPFTTASVDFIWPDDWLV
jgi:hypothetical protein